ncbi:hypothetical protein ACJIZ3_013686 [Penstemon smallii]|uniref:TmcB/TmcC TPR repeats domain-containing protein n=1 Tax=Penstemon smallii TaxID=265156 RepID=A0ABD3RHF3_9LAMI
MNNSLQKDETSGIITEPSFSIYSINDKFGDTGDLIKDDPNKFEKSVPIEHQNTEPQFSFGMIKEDEEVEGDEETERESNRFEDIKIGVEGESTSFPISDESGDLEKYYDSMIRENPENPLVLRDYAHYLESKRDLTGAEEYYFRATVADPKNGEIMYRYAKLVWELHRDFNKASYYFERAAKAAPGNSHVLAAYASFLWETDENNEEDYSSNTQAENADNEVMDFEEENRPSNPPLHLAVGPGINPNGVDSWNNAAYIDTSSNESSNVEQYYKRMVEENPSNVVLLKNYARFLHQSKGDLDLAEDYYTRAIEVDPLDGEILSLYANLVWQLHRDKDRAMSYFELAVQATPKDSDVLASYAKFLWEIED